MVSISAGRPAFRGALALKTADQTSVNLTGGFNKIVFNSTSYDTDSIFDDANDQLTVPTGWTKVRVTGNLVCTSVAATADLRLSILKNNGFFDERASNAYDGQGSVSTSHEANVTTGVIAVVAGDDFTLAAVSTDSSVTVAQVGTWLAMELIE